MTADLEQGHRLAHNDDDDDMVIAGVLPPVYGNNVMNTSSNCELGRGAPMTPGLWALSYG